MELTWIASLSSTSIHAADAVVRGATLVDSRLHEAMEPPITSLRNEIRSAGLPELRFWRNLASFAHQMENNRELAAAAIRRTAGWLPTYESVATRLAAQIGTLESVLAAAVPQLVDQLAHRARPIREAFETYGPGLLRSIQQETDSRLLVPRAEVALVHPVLGGGGSAHLANNSVRFEAVLTNNEPRVPEVVRLAWLLSQLNLDLPAYSETIPRDDVPFLAQLALLPPALHAAEYLEFGRFDPEHLSLALSAWWPETPQPMSAYNPPLHETLWLWWQTFLTSRPAWNVALSALYKMVGGTAA